jgi:hypothetical protein
LVENEPISCPFLHEFQHPKGKLQVLFGHYCN